MLNSLVLQPSPCLVRVGARWMLESPPGQRAVPEPKTVGSLAAVEGVLWS